MEYCVKKAFRSIVHVHPRRHPGVLSTGGGIQQYIRRRPHLGVSPRGGILDAASTGIIWKAAFRTDPVRAASSCRGKLAAVGCGRQLDGTRV